jgi:galactokinase
MNVAPEKLLEAFQQRFRVKPQLFRAPGRVNLIGEHTDYNNGFVMPAAIELCTWVAIAPRTDRQTNDRHVNDRENNDRENNDRENNDRRISVVSTQFGEEFEFSLDQAALRRNSWTDYVQGVAVTLDKAGTRLQGANLMIGESVPMGSGLSSSAAIEVATGFSLLSISSAEMKLVELAKLCQRAENEFVGARCGIMDQFIACLGEQGHCLMIDCQSLDYRPLPIPEDVSLVICNTMIRHGLAGGEYNARRSQCEEAVAVLSRFVPGIRSLRDVTPEQVERFGPELPEVIRKRCRHVVSEIQRVRDAARALESSDLVQFGELMRQSHSSLRDDYEVSCRELDLMVEIAARQPGVYGARMTGGGFGGCTVNLVRKGEAEQFKTTVAAEYHRLTGIRPEIYRTGAAAGVRQVL